jgi:hypothetical protein
MSLFSRKAELVPVEPKPGGGLNVLRGMTLIHARNPQGAARLKDDLQLDSDTIVNFAKHGGPLPLAKVPLLLKFLGVQATYDADRDLLVSTAPEPQPMGIAPERYVPPASDTTLHWPPFSAETPHTPGMLRPLPARRTGWA